jgi:trimethylamine--corrinoid protein Co-methyltransferase
LIISNYSDRQTPQFRVLSDSQCHELYLTTLECLNRIGVQVNNAEARDLLLQAGARFQDNIAYIPPHLIQEALVSAPRTFTIWGRDHTNQMRIAPDRVHFGPGPTCTYFMDPETGERRPARRGDAGLTARVCDALPNIDYVMGLSLFDDVTTVLASVYEFAEEIANTTKPILAWAHRTEALADIYEIACLVAGGEAAFVARPNFGLFSTYPSPLRHTDEDLSNILWAAEHNLPIVYLGGPTVGLESPVTGASGLVLLMANVLSAVAIVQLKKRGAPIVVGGVPSAMDLRTARPAYGSPEMSLNSAAAVDIARYLGLPFMGTAGASESKILDSQAALESAIQIIMASLSGTALVHDVGFLDCADIGSLEMLVMADEIISMSRRIQRGIEVNQEAIMLDLIEQVGPGGSFLAEPRSAVLCRSEVWMPTLLDRKFYPNWVKDGRKTMETRVHEKLGKILATHQVPTLAPEIAAGIDTILFNAEMRERGNSA